MKKNIIFFIFLSFILKVNSQNINGVIEYKKTYHKSFKEMNQSLKENDPKKFEEYNNIWEDSKNLLDKVKFILIFNRLESIFKAEKIVDHDINEFDLQFALGSFGSSIFYTNLLKNSYIMQTDDYGERFLVEMPKIDWEITSESKIINGNYCFKAISSTNTMGRYGNIKRIVEAWFTKDIPLSYGPIGFGGLPGLIIELVYDNEVYTFVSINYNKNLKIIKPVKGIQVTKEEFDNIGLNKIKNYKSMFD